MYTAAREQGAYIPLARKYELQHTSGRASNSIAIIIILSPKINEESKGLK